jgi:hypothetical protein
MKTAVDRIGRGKIRQVNARFAAMASHYLFETDFCNPASGWERAFGAPLVQAQWRAVKLKRTYKTPVDAYGSQCPTSLILMPLTIGLKIGASNNGPSSPMEGCPVASQMCMQPRWLV